MKYILIVPDGMADYNIEELGNKTALEYAKTPNMDKLAKDGIVGRVHTIPDGMPPGSDVAALSIMGYDPSVYYTGRAPLEAANQGIILKPTDIAFRCNLINTDGVNIIDYSGGEIPTSQSRELIAVLQQELGDEEFRFYPGVSYRHLMVQANGSANVRCTPPHDVMGQEIVPNLPTGDGQDKLREFIFTSYDILKNHPINKKREQENCRAANMAWFWGQGVQPRLSNFTKRFDVTGTVISAVDLIRGIARLAGLKAPEIEGATGTVNTNWKGKSAAAIDALKTDDFVMLHIEAPDEAGHQGSLFDKVKSIELTDSEIVGPIMEEAARYGDYRMLILPDHYTPIIKRTHVGNPVPFLLSGVGIKSEEAVLSENYADSADVVIKNGYELINELFK